MTEITVTLIENNHTVHVQIEGTASAQPTRREETYAMAVCKALEYMVPKIATELLGATHADIIRDLHEN